MGDIDAAKRVFDDSPNSKGSSLLKPLISMSDGRYQDAIDEWRILLEDNQRADGALVAHNLAVCLLYTGQLDEVRWLP
jgi:lipopolysaccharide biosynthesis regulator YciM